MRDEDDTIGVDVRRAWLLDRIGRTRDGDVDAAMSAVVELVAVATGEAASLRALSDDGTALHPVAAHHPDPEVRAAMADVMSRSVPADSGLWGPVVAALEPRRYAMTPGAPDPRASPVQQEFLRRYPVTAVIGVPLTDAGRMVGGLSLVRFTDPRPFTDADEDILLACAPWLVPLLLRRRELASTTPTASAGGVDVPGDSD